MLISDLSRWSDDELKAELERRKVYHHCESYARECRCDERRVEIVCKNQGFYPRYGCLTCNRWGHQTKIGWFTDLLIMSIPEKQVIFRMNSVV